MLTLKCFLCFKIDHRIAHNKIVYHSFYLSLPNVNENFETLDQWLYNDYNLTNIICSNMALNDVFLLANDMTLFQMR